MLTRSLIAQGLYLLAALTFSARLTVRTKNMLWGGLCLYGLFVLWAMLFCVVIPLMLERFGVDSHEITHAFPEATGVLPIILLGWAPAFAFAGLVRVASQKASNSCHLF